jgi:imidazolonepropionase-like amidohydrolase
VLWLNVGGVSMNPFGGMGRRGGGAKSNDVDGIRQALAIAKLLGRGVVLQKPISAWLVPDEIAATGSMVYLSPRDRLPADPTDPDTTGSNLASAALLAKAGVPVAVTCPVGMFGGAGVGTGGIMGQDLNTPHLDAAFAVRGGLDNRKALRTLTLDAAKILGVERRIGSLEAGKDADVLILQGDPLHYATFVTVAFVNGKIVYEMAKEPLYKHLAR